ncbi:DUF4032 domain-containing protein [Chloroflexota bacterium]
MTQSPENLFIRPGFPDFLDLPWGLPLNEWNESCSRIEYVPKGLSRHVVKFVNYDGVIFAVKELPPSLAEKEFSMLREIEDMKLPSVTPVGHASTLTSQGPTSILVTRHLNGSIPFRLLFLGQSYQRYRKHLLGAIAGLLVQLHLAGVYWGDCSLSNALFRRDAGTLQAYLVDAETSEVYPGEIKPALRYHDLEIMEQNINGEIIDLQASKELIDIVKVVPVSEVGAYIRIQYQRLWEEITKELIINKGEYYRIQERIRALNDIGFSVGNVELAPVEEGNQLRIQVAITDRNFHRDQLLGLSGLDVEELQAQKMMNEIQEIKATLSQDHNRSTPLSVAAFHWLENIYKPFSNWLFPFVNDHTSLPELYCNLLEHKWFLSENAQYDVGHQVAIDDYLTNFYPHLD